MGDTNDIYRDRFCFFMSGPRDSHRAAGDDRRGRHLPMERRDARPQRHAVARVRICRDINLRGPQRPLSDAVLTCVGLIDRRRFRRGVFPGKRAQNQALWWAENGSGWEGIVNAEPAAVKAIRESRIVLIRRLVIEEPASVTCPLKR